MVISEVPSLLAESGWKAVKELGAVDGFHIDEVENLQHAINARSLGSLVHDSRSTEQAQNISKKHVHGLGVRRTMFSKVTGRPSRY